MSSKSSKEKEKKPGRRLQNSGEPNPAATGGGGGDNNQPQELIIPLVQLDLMIHQKAREDNPVEVRFQNGRYEVLLNGSRLGNVPAGNYEARLTPRLALSGRIKSVGDNPAAVRISVDA